MERQNFRTNSAENRFFFFANKDLAFLWCFEHILMLRVFLRIEDNARISSVPFIADNKTEIYSLQTMQGEHFTGHQKTNEKQKNIVLPNL